VLLTDKIDQIDQIDQTDETDLFYEKHLKMAMKMAIIAVITSKEV